MSYPKVLSERETLEQAINGMSLARFGDGELRLATGGDSASQRTQPPGLKEELLSILKYPKKGLLVGIPNLTKDSPKYKQWLTYASPMYTRLYAQDTIYGSAFITRPDSAPWIDVPEYWTRCAALWSGKDVCLVRGDTKSLTPEMIGSTVRSLREVIVPAREAYADINRIEAEIGATPETVLVCAGVTATCLAYRLTGKGIHAIDIGHLGMFMKYQGAYRYSVRDLISDRHLIQNRKMHESPRGYGGSGFKQAEAVLDFIKYTGSKSIVDYGCGESTLQQRLRVLEWQGGINEYDPAVKGRDKLPRPAHLVVCTDVLEHVEPAYLDNVLAHLRALAVKGAYLVIACRPANKIMPDGRNAHLIVESPDWWVQRIRSTNRWKLHKRQDTPKGEGMFHDVRLWLLTA